ncbi:MAG: hypothetical protein J6Y47_02095 [Bacteroidales bacterium]|nr:hypothetical protein [Bacteroidales bacterium]
MIDGIFVSKRIVIIIGVLTIWIIVGLNRLHVIKSSDMVIAYSHIIHYPDMSALEYTYQGKRYTDLYQNNMGIPSRVTILVKKEHPNRYVFYTFLGFWNIGLVAGIFFSAVWLIYCQTAYADKDKITWMNTVFQRIQQKYERHRKK